MKKLLILAAMAFVVPLVASAQEVSTSESASTEAAVTTDTTTTETSVGSTGGQVNVTPPPRKPRENSVPPPKGIPPRDTPAGTPQGKRQYEPAQLRENGVVPLKGIPPGGTPAGTPQGKRMMQGSTTDDGKAMVPPRVIEKREALMEKRASSSAAREERREEARERMLEKRTEMMKRIVAQQIHRMEAMIERLAKIADRLESRIKKFKERGVDTTKPEELLRIARAKLDEARTVLKDAKTQAETVASMSEGGVQGTLSGDTGKDVDMGKAVRSVLEKARESVRAAHRALVDAIASLNAGAKVTTGPTTTSGPTTGTP